MTGGEDGGRRRMGEDERGKEGETEEDEGDWIDEGRGFFLMVAVVVSVVQGMEEAVEEAAAMVGVVAAAVVRQK